MSATNHTTNYSLPQFIGTDIPTWLTDVNGAMSAIDTAIKAAKDAGDQGISDAGAVATRMTAAENGLTTTNNNLGTLQTTVQSQNGMISANTTKIGSAQLVTTAQNLSGAVNELYTRFDEELLWTNASPGDAFLPQTISLDLTAYKEFYVVLRDNISSSSYKAQVIPTKNITIGVTEWTGFSILKRSFNVTNAGVVVTAGLTSSTISSYTEDNEMMIPVYLYGIK